MIDEKKLLQKGGFIYYLKNAGVLQDLLGFHWKMLLLWLTSIYDTLRTVFSFIPPFSLLYFVYDLYKEYQYTVQCILEDKRIISEATYTHNLLLALQDSRKKRLESNLADVAAKSTPPSIHLSDDGHSVIIDNGKGQTLSVTIKQFKKLAKSSKYKDILKA